MFPSILDMAIRTRMSPSELRFMADILEAFQARIPKDEGCSLQNSHNWGYKVEEGKEVENEETENEH